MASPGGTVTFLAAGESVTDSGAATDAYPDVADGETVSASVQFGTAERRVVDGVDRFIIPATVNLFDDPATLNSGAGVKRDDGFAWSLDGRLLVAQGDPVRVGSVWRVDCLVSQ